MKESKKVKYRFVARTMMLLSFVSYLLYNDIVLFSSLICVPIGVAGAILEGYMIWEPEKYEDYKE